MPDGVGVGLADADGDGAGDGVGVGESLADGEALADGDALALGFGLVAEAAVQPVSTIATKLVAPNKARWRGMMVQRSRRLFHAGGG
jgi:hypothetical protein